MSINDWVNRIHHGNCLDVMYRMPENSIDFCMFSPPYWGLRDYGDETIVDYGDYTGQLGLEPHPQMYIQHMVTICQAVKRVLKPTGNLYLNLGDTYYSGATGSQGKKDDSWHRLSRTASTTSRKNIDYSQRSNWLQPKQKLLIPHRVAIALQHDGWILRNDIIWHKPNAMPSSVKDRLNVTHEHVFHFVLSRRYYYDLDAIREPSTSMNRLRDKNKEKSNLGYPKGDRFSPGLRFEQHPKGKNPGDVYKSTEGHYAIGREHSGYYDKNGTPRFNPKGKNPGDFWVINTKPFKGAHFAVYPIELCEKPIKSSCPEGGIVLDPMCGAGTTLIAAHQLGRNWIGIELNPKYVEEIAKPRILNLSQRLTQWI